MKFKIGLVMLCCLLISSCKVTLTDIPWQNSNATPEQNKYTYDNVVDGLLNTENEQGLEVHYMLLPTGHKKVGSEMSKPTYIVVHNTANTAPAVNEVTYLNRSTNTSYTSFHFAVDDVNVYQAVNMKYNAWHAGENTMNRQSIGVEIAKSMISDTTIKDKAINNGAKLVAMLMIEYDIPIERVITHQAVTGKHCPHDILDRYGYDKFLNLVRSYLK
jgi:N-acetylmuramoyl-L-alanine amidase CwlA